jgi:polar amino acid transport system substrate-binding protein
MARGEGSVASSGHAILLQPQRAPAEPGAARFDSRTLLANHCRSPAAIPASQAPLPNGESFMSNVFGRALLALLLGSCTAVAAAAVAVPAPGTSPRIDSIKKAGVLRVGVLANAPWLVENTSGQGEAWSGPAWLLANEYAKRLGVKLQAIPVSHETKVPVLASNQVDISVTPLAETPERLKVVDFVIYSTTSVCMYGLASNPKFANAKSVDELNRPGITIAYYTGGGEEGWVKERFPKATLRGVAGSGISPVEEVMAKRADAVPINRVPWVAMGRKLTQLAVLPKENNCQDSKEKAAPVGMAIDKNQDAFLQWARAVEKEIEPQLRKDEMRVVETMK